MTELKLEKTLVMQTHQFTVRTPESSIYLMRMNGDKQKQPCEMKKPTMVGGGIFLINLSSLHWSEILFLFVLFLHRIEKMTAPKLGETQIGGESIEAEYEAMCVCVYTHSQ